MARIAYFTLHFLVVEIKTQHSYFDSAKDNLMELNRDTAVQIVIASLREVLEQAEEPVPADLGEETVIVGNNAALDSLGVVSLIVEIESRLEMDHEISVTLASDRAMSQRSSPFRTVSVLADYMCSVIKEG
jgi:acyl carrier protein